VAKRKVASKPRTTPGTIAWTDLTVRDAERVGHFYSSVTGWRPEPVSMGTYNDFDMSPRQAKSGRRRVSRAGDQRTAAAAVADLHQGAKPQ
jgi:predicted enzyme related to lactoylglutathione lyase